MDKGNSFETVEIEYIKYKNNEKSIYHHAFVIRSVIERAYQTIRFLKKFKHRFHASCIDGWRQVRDVENHIPDCPICREPLPPSFWQRTIRALHRLGGFLYNALHLREMQVHIGVERQNDGHNQNWQWRFYPSAGHSYLMLHLIQIR